MCVCTERGESERTASLTLNSIAYSKTSYALDSTNRNARHSSSHVRTPATPARLMQTKMNRALLATMVATAFTCAPLVLYSSQSGPAAS